ncbi:MAG: ATP-dependent Clp protease proteolytic subunit [Leptospirales bacterium]
MKTNELNNDKENVKPSRFREKIQEQFVKNRQIYLWGAVQDKSSEDLIEKFMFLENEEPGKPIYFFINSPGGVISSGMAVFDLMNMISSPVYTVDMGMAASMGALLFSAGEKGHRYMFSHARVMIHQPLISGQIVAPAIDIKIHAEEIKKTRTELNQILSDSTGKSIEQIAEDTDRDYWMNAPEAIKYGIADKILKDASELIQKPTKTEKPKKKTSPDKDSNNK